jgi:hypothetical protein
VRPEHKARNPVLGTDASPVERPGTWVGAAGWRKLGLIRASETVRRGDPLME